MKNRIKNKAPEISSRAEMESVVGEVTRLKISEQELVTGMELEMARVRERYEGRLAETRAEMQSKVETLMAWAEANEAEFGKAKSIETIHGVIGWRTGTPALKTLSGWTWDRALEKMQSFGVRTEAYIRTKTEVDKQAVLADRATFEEITGVPLAQIGVRVVQEESFFVEPKVETVETREVAA